MPARDKTGPRGEGPMTGRGFGDCNPEATNQRGCGCARGRGRGCGFRTQQEVKKD